MNREEKLAYGKGYSAGAKRAWPLHRPPVPGEIQIAHLMKAATALRDAADDICSTLLPSDEFVRKLGPLVDAVDDANKEISAWCLQNGLPDTKTCPNCGMNLQL